MASTVTQYSTMNTLIHTTSSSSSSQSNPISSLPHNNSSASTLRPPPQPQSTTANRARTSQESSRSLSPSTARRLAPPTPTSTPLQYGQPPQTSRSVSSPLLLSLRTLPRTDVRTPTPPSILRRASERQAASASASGSAAAAAAGRRHSTPTPTLEQSPMPPLLHHRPKSDSAATKAWRDKAEFTTPDGKEVVSGLNGQLDLELGSPGGLGGGGNHLDSAPTTPSSTTCTTLESVDRLSLYPTTPHLVPASSLYLHHHHGLQQPQPQPQQQQQRYKSTRSGSFSQSPPPPPSLSPQSKLAPVRPAVVVVLAGNSPVMDRSTQRFI